MSWPDKKAYTVAELAEIFRDTLTDCEVNLSAESARLRQEELETLITNMNRDIAQERRAQCLRYAGIYHSKQSGDYSPELILETAAKFEAYIKGEQ